MIYLPACAHLRGATKAVEPSLLSSRRHQTTCSHIFPTESHFHKEADAVLLSMQDNLEWMEDAFELDVNMDQGVLKLETPEDGTWVLNKQGPNKQIWWSSPLSGPIRFEFHGINGGVWRSTRTQVGLLDLLRDEMSEVFDTDIPWK